MKVLIGCEISGKVRNAMRDLGIDATSCDIEPSDAEGPHIQDDIRNHLHKGWDMLIAFPPCTYICFAGIRWNTNNPEREQKTRDAIEFFLELWNAPIPKIAIENPVGVIPRRTGIKWNQMIHPWQFGHAEQKKTCLWLKNLPPLVATRVMEGREQRMWKMPPSPDRAKKRSVTYDGIAEAMAQQWTGKTQ